MSLVDHLENQAPGCCAPAGAAAGGAAALALLAPLVKCWSVLRGMRFWQLAPGDSCSFVQTVAVTPASAWPFLHPLRGAGFVLPA